MNNIQICERKRGRPQKKDYDPETLMKELVDTVAEVYNNTNEKIYSGSGTIKFFLCAGFCLSLFER